MRFLLVAVLATCLAPVAAAAPFSVKARGIVSGPVQLAAGCDAGTSENTPLIATDPGRPRRLAVTYAIGDGRAAVLARSRDAGAHWRRRPIPGTLTCDDGSAYANRFDPDLAFAPDHRLWLSESLQAAGSGTAGIATLAGPVPLGSVTADDPLIGAQRGLLAFDPARPGEADVLLERIPYPATYAPVSTQLQIASSHDQGRGWSTREIFDPLAAGQPAQAVTALGLVRRGPTVLAMAALNDLAAAVPGTPPTDAQSDVVIRSTDGGDSFGAPVAVGRSSLCVCKPAQAPDGTVYQLVPHTDGRLNVARSRTSGATWSELPVAHYPGLADPMVAAGPHGRVGIVVYERDGDTGRLHVLVSGDAGATWQDLVSGPSFDISALGPVDDTSPLGPVQGIAATPTGFAVAATVPSADGSDIALLCVSPRAAARARTRRPGRAAPSVAAGRSQTRC